MVENTIYGLRQEEATYGLWYESRPQSHPIWLVLPGLLIHFGSWGLQQCFDGAVSPTCWLGGEGQQKVSGSQVRKARPSWTKLDFSLMLLKCDPWLMEFLTPCTEISRPDSHSLNTLKYHCSNLFQYISSKCFKDNFGVYVLTCSERVTHCISSVKLQFDFCVSVLVKFANTGSFWEKVTSVEQVWKINTKN